MNYNFIPIAPETFGAWGKDTEHLFSEIGKRIRLNSGEPRTTEFLRQQISIELQRGDAASVLGTLPTNRLLFRLSFKFSVIIVHFRLMHIFLIFFLLEYQY